MTPQELKNSILQLAIQGKLVEQRAEEGTGEQLYREILAEKAKLVKAGKIKKEKPLPEIAEDEKPFDIPENWMWVRLGGYAEKITDQVASGSFASLRDNVPSLKQPDYAIMVKIADFSNNFTRNLTYTSKRGYEFLSNSNLFGGELILSNIGSIGKCFIVPNLNQRMTLAPNAVMVRLVLTDLRDYLYYFILSSQGLLELLNITSGTAMRKFNKTDLKGILIPLPPLAEQKRIVAKIEELLPYIDRYEQAWRKLEDFNKRFPGDMQKSILQFAIQGKLVEQRAEEGTGAELYRQIQAEKQRLIKAGTIKKEKPLPEIAEDEKPFDTPESWKWVRLGEAISLLSGTDFKPEDYNDSKNGIPYITGASSLSSTGVLINRWTETPHIIANRGDVLLVCKGSGYGKVVVCDVDEAHIARQIMAIKYSINLCMEYITTYLRASFKTIKLNGQGVIPGIDRGSVLNMIFPLPPLAEQKRIVAKLEEILPLCEKLK